MLKRGNAWNAQHTPVEGLVNKHSESGVCIKCAGIAKPGIAL